MMKDAALSVSREQIIRIRLGPEADYHSQSLLSFGLFLPQLPDSGLESYSKDGIIFIISTFHATLSFIKAHKSGSQDIFTICKGNNSMEFIMLKSLVFRFAEI
jgi:hypothetical protein